MLGFLLGDPVLPDLKTGPRLDGILTHFAGLSLDHLIPLMHPAILCGPTLLAGRPALDLP